MLISVFHLIIALRMRTLIQGLLQCSFLLGRHVSKPLEYEPMILECMLKDNGVDLPEP